VRNWLPVVIAFAQLSECEQPAGGVRASSRRFDKSTCSLTNGKRLNASTTLILSAFVFSRRHDLIVLGALVLTDDLSF
jgi:hypothetical protein